MRLAAAPTARGKWLRRLRRFRLRHEGPKDRHGSERHRSHTQESSRLAEFFHREAEDRGAERSANAGESADSTLGQIEPAASFGDIGES